MKLLKELSVQNILGEGIQWHHPSQSIWWTDIMSALLYQYIPESDITLTHIMPERVGSFAFTNIADRLIVAFASGIAFYHLKTKEIDWLARPEQDNVGNRFNDGRVDRLGRFWAGTMVEDDALSNNDGTLYLIDEHQNCHSVLNGLKISNSLCFDLNKDSFYHTDTPTHTIKRYKVPSQLSEFELINELTTIEDTHFPDGSCIDANNYLWNAQWGGAQVKRYAPDGTVNLTLNVPVPHPSCVAIGGSNLDWLIVSSAQQGLSKSELAKYPKSGNVFIYQLEHIKGVIENHYLC